MSIFEMKVSIDPAVNVAAEVERVVAAIVAQIRAGQQGAEVLNAQGHVRGWWQIEDSTEVDMGRPFRPSPLALVDILPDFPPSSSSYAMSKY